MLFNKQTIAFILLAKPERSCVLAVVPTIGLSQWRSLWQWFIVFNTHIDVGIFETIWFHIKWTIDWVDSRLSLVLYIEGVIAVHFFAALRFHCLMRLNRPERRLKMEWANLRLRMTHNCMGCVVWYQIILVSFISFITSGCKVHCRFIFFTFKMPQNLS